MCIIYVSILFKSQLIYKEYIKKISIEPTFMKLLITRLLNNSHAHCTYNIQIIDEEIYVITPVQL